MGQRRFLATMQQVNRCRRAGDLLCCSLAEGDRVEVTQIRYGQGVFQVQVCGRDGWFTPLRVWAEPRESQLSRVPTLFDER